MSIGTPVFFLHICNSKFVSFCDDDVIEGSSDESTSGCKADSEEDIGLQMHFERVSMRTGMYITMRMALPYIIAIIAILGANVSMCL